MTTTVILNFIWEMEELSIVNLQQLEQALHHEWQNLPKNRIRRFTDSMRRRVETIIRARGGFIYIICCYRKYTSPEM
jgi:hypothetical protein